MSEMSKKFMELAKFEERDELEKIVREWYQRRYERGEISKELLEANLKNIPELDIGILRYFAGWAKKDKTKKEA